MRKELYDGKISNFLVSVKLSYCIQIDIFEKGIVVQIKSIFIVVKGIVQGVGFRPFVYTTAMAYDLCGNVSNTGEGVSIHLEGPSDAIERFTTILRNDPPMLSRIDQYRYL